MKLIRKMKHADNQKEMSENTDGRTWYLRDDPLRYLDEEDQFRHKGYVQILMEAVREVSPPFTLGVFGSWGVGKTSIVNDFCKSISEDKALSSTTAVAYIDIWKYEKDALRRQFLLDVEGQLKDAGRLPKDRDVQAQLYTTWTEEGQTEPRFSWRRLKEVKWLLLEVLIIVTAGLVLISLLPVNQPTQIALSSLLIPLLLYAIPRLSRVVVVQQKYTITEPALYSSEQFEKAFGDMVTDATCRKMVIVIDNLDRCSRDRVVEVLGTVKTYLEPRGKDKCIFIIPCDDSAIKEQVKAAYAIPDKGDEKTDVEGYADEYLRKFFNVSIRITPFIEKEIEPYIEMLLGKIKMTEDMPDEQIKQLAQMTGFVFRKNPRRIKQFLNNLSSKYLLVKEREAGSMPMIQPAISDNILFLTKVSIIETKFPEQFQDFLADDNLYGELVRLLHTPQAANGEAADVLKDDELRSFLIFTRHVTAQNYKAFFQLKQSPHEAKIPNYDHFRDAVRNEQREIVSGLFEKADEESNKARLDEIMQQIRGNATRGYSNYTVNAISVGCAIIPKLSLENHEQLAREVIGTIASYSDVLAKLSSLVPAEIFGLMPFTSPDDSRPVIDEYINLYSQEPEPTHAEGIRLAIAESIVRNLEQLSPAQLGMVCDATAGFQSINPDLLLVVSSTDEAKAALVAGPLVGKVIQEIKGEEVASFAQTEESTQKHAPLIEFVLRCQDLAEEDAGEIWTKKLAELLEFAVSQNNPQLEVYIHRCIDESEKLLSKAESSTIDQLAHLLGQRYPQADDHRRLAIVLTLCAMYQYCSGGQQTGTHSLVVDQFVRSEPPENVARFLVAQANEQFTNLPYHTDVFNSLAQRVVSEGNEETRRQILSSYLDVDGANRIDLLVRLLRALIERPEVSVSIPLVEEFSKGFPTGNRGKGLVAPILRETIHPSRGSIPVPERKSLLGLAIYLKEWHTKEFQADFDGGLGELLASDDASLRQLGLGVMDSAHVESALSHERLMKILRDLAASLIERRPSPDDSIMQQLSLVMGAKRGVLTLGSVTRIVEWLRQIIQPQVAASYRKQAFSHLSSFSGLPKSVLEGLIPELVGYARSEGDPGMRDLIEESILALRRGNLPLNRDIWEDVYGYHQSLIASPDETQRQRGSRLRQLMTQITKEARKEAEQGKGIEEEALGEGSSPD